MKKEPHINDDKMKQAIESDAPESSVHSSSKEKKGKFLNNVSFTFVFLILVVITTFCLFGFAYTVEKMRIMEEESENHILRVQNLLMTTNQNLLKQKDVLTQEINMVHRMQNLAQRSDNIVTLAQVETLIRMASQLLYFQQNIPSAITLLAEADKQLMSLNNPELRDFRAQIAASIGQLKVISQLDMEGILLRLNQLFMQVTSFPTLREERNIPSHAVPGLSETAFNQLPAWKRGLLTSWEQLKSLILIQYHENSVGKPALPHNRAFSDQQLQAQLFMAQWAVMYGKQTLYTTSLNAASRILNQNYLLDAPAVSTALTQLHQLAQIRLDVDYPDLQPLLTTLRDLEAAQQNAQPVPTAEEQPVERHVYSAFVKVLPNPQDSV